MDQAAAVEKTPPHWKRRFFTIWGGQVFSTVGSSVATFALIWWLTIQTGSATVLALAGIASGLPALLVMPFAGACVDRWSRRLIMIGADAFIALASLLLAYVSFAGLLQPWHVVVAMVVRSLGGAFHSPAMLASTPLLMPKERLSQVAGMNATLGGVMGVASAPVAALLVAELPLHGIMLIDAVTAVIAISPLLFVTIPQPARRDLLADGAAKPSLWQDVRSGLRYITAWPGLLLFTGLNLLLNLFCNPPLSLLPILVTKHFGGGALQLASLESVVSAGLIAGGLLLTAWGGFTRRVATWALAAFLGACGILLVAAAPAQSFWLALTGMAIVGLAIALANAPVNAILQATVEPDVQGRVFALLASMNGAAVPLSLAIAGPLADAFGVRMVFLVGGLGVLAGALFALRSADVFYLEDGRPAPEETAA